MQTYQETLSQLNELMTTSFKQISEINMQTYDLVVKSQTELANVCVRNGLRQLAIAKEIQNPSSYLEQQKELTQETVEELQKFSATTVKQATNTRDNLIDWVEGNIKAVATLNPISKAA